ncbi:hypothetical protein N7E81_15935 [Reichenbachiella carrageenanivorans]|uniref:Viral A-type inclusion protein n=1 Tax=Reichenbachiella carrageenanivorans TaxID=2979869 RepID=A0ABY6CY63_9BACT|nr:hypothetical protein [Reichenbachiella carrageenanivorans]UXX78847.1 hypothetical protein N7E81_15935 [Reichenbachiella carrageenanivorans]
MTRKSHFALALFFLLLTVVGCGSEKKEQQALFGEVMLVHDDVMPKMDKLRGLAQELSQQADSLIADSLADHSTQVAEIRSLSEQLTNANEGMMVWMRNFEQIEDGTPHDEAMQYLTEQRKLIQQVKDDMLNAKKEAEAYLSKD